MKRIALIMLLLFLFACTKTQVPQAAINQENGIPVEEQRYEEPLNVQIKTVSSPDKVELGQTFNITWRIESNKNLSIPHTAIHYGASSVPYTQSAADYRFASKVLSGTIPALFTTEFAIETYGTIYFRAHAIIDGKDYWSDEKLLIVNAPKAQEATPQIKQFVIETDDDAFYPAGPITVKKGERVYIDFIARKENIYYGGIQVKSKYFDTGKINKGEKASVDFVAFDSFTITSYWPASGVRKADLNVIVT